MTPVLNFDQLTHPATAPEWAKTLLNNAATLKLSTSSWQAGGITRTILAAVAFALSFQDTTASAIAQGGVLDFAATGTVTYTMPDGTTVISPVTPDPSKPSENPGGDPGWLDVLADGLYNVARIKASSAGGSEAIINTSASTYGPFAAGTYHVSNPFNKATYSNVATLSIPPSAIAGTSIIGVVSLAGVIKVQTSTNHGLLNGSIAGIVGVQGIPALALPTAWVVDKIDNTHFTLRGSTFAGVFTGGGTAYVPTVASVTADTIGAGSTSTNAAGVADVHTVIQTVTSLAGVSVDNLAPFLGSDVESNVKLAARCRLKLQSLSGGGPKGAYDWAARSSQQLAPLLNPPASVSQAITRSKTFTDKSTGLVYVWIATASGPPSSNDVDVTANVVGVFAEPWVSTSSTLAANEVDVAAVLDVWVPAQLATAATQSMFQNALQFYFAIADIGGFTDPNGAYANVIPFNGVIAAASAAAQAAQVPITQIKLTLNGATIDIPLALSASNAQVAVLVPAVPTVNLHAAA